MPIRPFQLLSVFRIIQVLLRRYYYTTLTRRPVSGPVITVGYLAAGNGRLAERRILLNAVQVSPAEAALVGVCRHFLCLLHCRWGAVVGVMQAGEVVG